MIIPNVVENNSYLPQTIVKTPHYTGYTFARKLFHTEVMKHWDFELNKKQLSQCKKFGNFTQVSDARVNRRFVDGNLFGNNLLNWNIFIKIN